MRAVVQRVLSAAVDVAENEVWTEISRIGPGLAVLLGVAEGDTEADVRYMADKIARMRVFEDDGGKMNRSVAEAGGAVLLVSQFTLLGDVRQGRRPSFTQAARPEQAQALYRAVADALAGHGIPVQTGRFQTHMRLHILNDGPVTVMLDSRKQF